MAEPLTLVEVAALVESLYGTGAELRLRRTGVGQWVASVWAWGANEMHEASHLSETPEAAIRELLREPESG